MRWWAVPLFSGALAVVALGAVFRTVQVSDELDAGSILVASENLQDPNFAKAVIVLLQYDEDEGAMGIVINRRTDAQLSSVMPDLKSGAKHRVYSGGPVQTDMMEVLFRATPAPESGLRVIGNVYATADSDSIQKLAETTAPERFRSYVGYAGWEGGQLEHEIALGAWTVMAPDPSLVFDDDPDSLWQRLNRRGQMRMAAGHFGRASAASSRLRKIRITFSS